jgi:hypothetical protein
MMNKTDIQKKGKLNSLYQLHRQLNKCQKIMPKKASKADEQFRYPGIVTYHPVDRQIL